MPLYFKNNQKPHKNKLLAQLYKEVTATAPSAVKGEEVYYSKTRELQYSQSLTYRLQVSTQDICFF